jgi:site-specific recombinase XerD
LRSGLDKAVAHHLPAWKGRLTPHVLRHYCASSLYRHGMDIVAIQEVLGHDWIATTMGYVHVHRAHVDDSWVKAGQRSAARLEGARR